MAKTKGIKVNSIVLGLILLVTFAAVGYALFTLYSGLTAEEPTPTTFDFSVIDYVTGDEPKDADHNIYILRASIKGKTAEEIDEIEFDSYSLAETKDSGETYKPDLEDYIYWVIANGTDFWDVQFVPILGTNIISLMNKSQGVQMVAYSKDELSTTVVNTTYDKWNVMTQTLNGSLGEGNVTTEKEGFLPYYDFRTNKNIRVVFNWTLNTSAELNYLDFESDYEHSIKVSGNSILVEVEATLLGEDLFKFDFNSAIGSTYVPQSVSVGYGHSGSITEWDSQS